MAARSRHRRIWQRGSWLAFALAGCIALSACGPLGDDDPDPTATSESLAQPTGAATEDATTESTETQVEETVVETEPATEESTPGLPSMFADSTPDMEPLVPTAEGTPASTPVFNDVIPSASPTSGEDATPVVPLETTSEADLPLPDGDGTSGAIPDATGEADEGQLLVAETPEAGPGTPASSPVVETIEQLTVETVSSCEPGDLPAIALLDTSYRTVSDVNIRSGPGADCDLLGISPIGEFRNVTLLAGPVQREDTDLVWVQVEVSGTTGWMVIEALEPAES